MKARLSAACWPVATAVVALGRVHEGERLPSLFEWHMAVRPGVAGVRYVHTWGHYALAVRARVLVDCLVLLTLFNECTVTRGRRMCWPADIAVISRVFLCLQRTRPSS